jgi:hypothetical protein
MFAQSEYTTILRQEQFPQTVKNLLKREATYKPNK